jgi:hypothetical protein
MKYMNTIRENIKGDGKFVFILLIYISLIMCKCLGCVLHSKITRNGQPLLIKCHANRGTLMDK